MPGRRREIFPNIVSTDGPPHSNQEGRHFHGYCYFPLVCNDLALAVAACARRPGVQQSREKD